MQYATNRHEQLIRILIAAVVIAGLLMCACEGKQSRPAAPIPEVATVTLTAQSVVLTTELPGRTTSYRIAEIRPQVSGLIQKRLFREGSEVKAGDVLYQIDAAPFQAALNSALANLTATKRNADGARSALNASMAGVSQQMATHENARKNFKRFEVLFKSKVISASKRDETATAAEVTQAALRAAQAKVESDKKAIASADAAIEQAEAAVEIARINLNYTKITAPIPGRIGKSNVTDGAIVTAYQPLALATIQQMDPIYVDVVQSTSELLRLRQRMEKGRIKTNGDKQKKVRLILETGEPYPLEGVLQFRDVTVDQTTGSVTLRIIFPNPDNTLLPGMFVRAVVQEGIAEQALLVSQQGVTRDTKGNPVALIVDETGEVQQRSLVLERAIKDKWLVSAGLAPGERVIVEGRQKVRPKDKVKVVDFESTQKKEN